MALRLQHPVQLKGEMTNSASKDPLVIRKLKAILETHLENEHFGVSELAKKAGLSRSSLHRKVHAYNGNSTSQFIREFRLKKAMEMLLDGEETASEVAYRVGFSSPTYFNTCFKVYYGYPPGEVKLRGGSSDEQKGHIVNTYPQVRTKDRITYLNRRLKHTKRWIVVLAIGIGVTMAWAASYYIDAKEEPQSAELAIVKEENSIAVLPFKNLSGDPDMDRICYAMTDAVITGLNELESVIVTPHNKVLKYADTEKDAPTIAEELGVDQIIFGNYQKYGEENSFNWHVIDGPENSILTSKRFNTDWNLEEMFSIQADVVENIATQLQINLRGEEFSDIDQFPTKNREAYDQWMLGAYLASTGTKENRENAIQYFKKAIALDEAFVYPYLEMAYLYLWGGTIHGRITQEEGWYKAKEYLGKVKKIDSTNLFVQQLLLDGLYVYEWDFETMEREYKKSSAASIYLLQTGRTEEALDMINDRIEKRPNSAFIYTKKAETLFHLARYEEAFDLLESKDSLIIRHLASLREAAKLCFYLQNYERSKWYLEQYMVKNKERPPIIIWLKALHNSLEDNTTELESNLNILRSQYLEEVSGSPAWFLALYYCWSGDREKAFEWLQKSYDRHEVEMIWLREESVLIPLRSDPRYVDLYHKVGFPTPPRPN
ncbi:helix-turn-helix domain-containing protein [Flavobacteriaceae bacterium D16]|nr:helix-turn-helix domain-containing protein [Flavobacteriaceae bacterium D16]